MGGVFMSTYRTKWPCCGLVTETDSYELDSCPECDLMIKEKFHKAEVKELKEANKAMLQELIECSYELQCLCGHPACKLCQRYGQLAEFIEEMKKAF